MSSSQQQQKQTQRQEQQHSQNPPAGFGSEAWMTDPFGLAQTANKTSAVDEVGNGQKSSYREQTYTLPGTITYQEWSG